MGSATRSSCLILIAALLWFASPAAAFGAGFVAPGASTKGTNYRHGDILNAVYFLSSAHSSLVRQIYFGNWLRDFSQLIDRKALEVVPEPILRAIVAIFAYGQFGYTTKEFEVTAERLGSYRPEEHIDNPKGYEGGIYTQLRPQVHPDELNIDNSGMKNYIANQEFSHMNDTSLDYIEKQLVAAIACGRARDFEAYTHLGAALHTLEDFVAHSNWLELCIQMLGAEAQSNSDQPNAMASVFAFTGGAAIVQTSRGRAPPLVTGTFGALDLYQTILGEMEDRASALSLSGLQMRLKGPNESLSSISQALLSLLTSLGDDEFGSDLMSVTKSATEDPADWGSLNKTPERLWNSIEPVFRLRDKIVRWIYDHLMVDSVANAIAKVSILLDKLVYKIIGTFLSPVLQDIVSALRFQSDDLLVKDQQVRSQNGEQSIFDATSTATDPTHSQLCKDHYDHDLNEIAGRVATKITTFTIKKIVEVWQPGSNVDVRPTLRSILSTLHHPYNYSKDDEIQALMVSEVVMWCTEQGTNSPEAYAGLIEKLSHSNKAKESGEEASRIAHSHVPAMTATYAGPNQISRTTAHDLTTIASKHKTGFVDRLSDNIEQNLKNNMIKGINIQDFPGIKQMLRSYPSSETPNPIDQSLVNFPGMSLLPCFEGIENSEILAATGMGLLLKDAVIDLRLRDTARVGREQIEARERLGSLEDRPVKEMLELLDVKPVEKTFERPTEESKARRLIDKLKISKKSEE